MFDKLFSQTPQERLLALNQIRESYSTQNVLEYKLQLDNSMLDLTLDLISKNCLVPLLKTAQIKRLNDFTPDASKCSQEEEILAADLALLVLGEMCSVAVLFLQSNGWEVVQEDEILYRSLESDAESSEPPDLFEGKSFERGSNPRQYLYVVDITLPYLCQCFLPMHSNNR
jgi:hypothetical protein